MPKVGKRAALVFLLILCFAIAPISEIGVVKAEPKTIVVPDDYPSIQQAIDSASVGDTVYVKSATYHENLVVNKSISLVGENVDTTIIDGNPPEGYRIPIKIQSDHVSVSGFKLLYGYAGITVGGVKFCSISGNRIAGNQHGISLVSSSYCNITRNYFELIGLSSAIQLSYSNNNLVTGNYIDSCTEGIQIREYSYGNTISENTIVNVSDAAVRLLYSNNNEVVENNVTNSGTGLIIYVSNNNTVYHNNFRNNTFQISTNEWYAQQWGYSFSNNTLNQNYWSNYNGTDTNGDGIGDTPYVIDENNQDNYPLIEPYIIPEFPSWIILPLLLMATLVAIIFKKRLSQHFIRTQNGKYRLKKTLPMGGE